MTRTLGILAALLLATALPAHAGTADVRVHARTDSLRARAGTRAGARHAATAGPPTSRSPGHAAATDRPATHAGAMPRTLGDIHIEGETPVPQVLFITARDQRRFMDFQHYRYLKTTTQLGETTPFPTWVAVIHTPPMDSPKETSR